jgi:hypothetical protein
VERDHTRALHRGTYCDIATRIDGQFQLIVEVKAIGVDLKDAQAKQAIDYACNQGIEWVALTTGNIWRVYRVIFSKPIEAELALNLNLLELNPKNPAHIESLYLLTRESMVKSGLHAFYDRLQATSRFYLGAVLLSDPVLEVARRELRRLSNVKLEIDELREALRQDVIKREVLEGDKADAAAKKVARTAAKVLRAKQDAEHEPPNESNEAAKEPEGSE